MDVNSLIDNYARLCYMGRTFAFGKTLWFKTASQFEYFKDREKTKEARSQDGTMSTVGDVGYVDEDGYVF